MPGKDVRLKFKSLELTREGTERHPFMIVKFDLVSPIIETILAVRVQFADSFEVMISLARQQIAKVATQLAEAAKQPSHPG